MKSIQFLSVLSLLLVACNSTGGSSGSGGNSGGARPGVQLNLTHDETEAELFIRRFEGFQVGLVNYFDVTAVEYVSRAFSAETVVFRLNNSGDTGPLHEAAADLAAELAIMHGWDETTAPEERLIESHLAIARIESIGIPAGARAGDLIPVRVTLTGNASDIHGGYVYRTPLVNTLGREVAYLKEGYLPFDIRDVNPEDVTDDMRADAKNLERRDSLLGASFILRNAVVLTADVERDDLSSDQIILPLQRTVEDEHRVRTLDSDLLPEVMRDIERQMAALGSPVEVSELGGRMFIKPVGVRERTLRQIYDQLEGLRVQVRPRNRVIVVFDDNLYRVAIYGEPRHRMLISDVALTTDPFTRRAARPYQLPFRVSCRVIERANPGTSRKYGVPDADDIARGVTPDGHKGRVRLAWSRWDDRGRMIQEGTEDFESTDVSDILRHLWTRGMGPRGVLAFVYEAVDTFSISAELGFNYLTIDLDALVAAAGG